MGSGRGRCTDGGVGIEISMAKARVAHEAGQQVILADAAYPAVVSKSFEHTILIHVLEHLPDLTSVSKVIDQAIEASVDYVHIKGPWFDADDYLAERGFALYWSTWPGHPTHLTCDNLREIMAELGEENFAISGKGPMIEDSMHPSVHPVGYEAGHYYKDGQYPPKEYVKFDIPIFSEVVCEIDLGGI
jgi:hypothetical protein